MNTVSPLRRHRPLFLPRPCVADREAQEGTHRKVAIQCHIVPPFIGPKSPPERDDRRLGWSRWRGLEITRFGSDSLRNFASNGVRRGKMTFLRKVEPSAAVATLPGRTQAVGETGTVVRNRYGAVLQDVQTLFDSGTIGGLDRRRAPGPVRRPPRRDRRAGLRRPARASRADGPPRLPFGPPRRPRRPGRLPGHLPDPRPPRRRRPQPGIGRELALRRRPARLGPRPRRHGPSPEARDPRGGDGGGPIRRGAKSARALRGPPRGAGPAAGAVSRGGRALLPGGPDLRGGRAPTGLAGRDGQEPAGTRPRTPARPADPPRPRT